MQSEKSDSSKHMKPGVVSHSIPCLGIVIQDTPCPGVYLGPKTSKRNEQMDSLGSSLKESYPCNYQKLVQLVQEGPLGYLSMLRLSSCLMSNEMTLFISY